MRTDNCFVSFTLKNYLMAHKKVSTRHLCQDISKASSPRNKFSNSWNIHLRAYSLLAWLYGIRIILFTNIKLTHVFIFQSSINVIRVIIIITSMSTFLSVESLLLELFYLTERDMQTVSKVLCLGFIICECLGNLFKVKQLVSI